MRIPIKKCVLAEKQKIRHNEKHRGRKRPERGKEDTTMALSQLADWAKDKAATACGAACGAADKPAETPAACGAAAPEEKPAACGSACGAGDKK